MASIKQKSPLQQLSFVLSGAAFVVGGIAVLVVAQLIETHFLPVKTDNAITYQVMIDDDLWVMGTSIKRRNCQFIPPTRVRTKGGQHLRLINHNKMPASSWMVGNDPQHFGPWQIVDAKGHNITIFQEFDCHPLWTQFVEIAKVEAK